MDNITNNNQSLIVKPNKNERELLIEHVKNWVILDQKIQMINEKTKQIRELKSTITTDICDYMKRNNITSNIGISNGELRMYDKKYLKDNREITISQDIKRVMHKL